MVHLLVSFWGFLSPCKPAAYKAAGLPLFYGPLNQALNKNRFSLRRSGVRKLGPHCNRSLAITNAPFGLGELTS